MRLEWVDDKNDPTDQGPDPAPSSPPPEDDAGGEAPQQVRPEPTDAVEEGQVHPEDTQDVAAAEGRRTRDSPEDSD